MWRKFPVVILLAASAPACATVARTPALAQWEHDASYSIRNSPTTLTVPQQGATFAAGTIDAVRYPRLAQAWQAGAAPVSPLIGREPALWLRELEVTPIPDSGGMVQLKAKALAPYPVRLTLLALEGGRPAILSQIDSKAWSTGTHYASLEVDYSAFAGTVVIVRVEGARQAFESWVRLEPGD